MASVLVAQSKQNYMSAEHTLAGTTAVTVTFGTDINESGINAVSIESTNNDVKLYVEFNGTAATVPGTNAAPVVSSPQMVGPSHGMKIWAVAQKSLTINIYNASGSSSDLLITGWLASTN